MTTQYVTGEGFVPEQTAPGDTGAEEDVYSPPAQLTGQESGGVTQHHHLLVAPGLPYLQQRGMGARPGLWSTRGYGGLPPIPPAPPPSYAHAQAQAQAFNLGLQEHQQNLEQQQQLGQPPQPMFIAHPMPVPDAAGQVDSTAKPLPALEILESKKNMRRLPGSFM